MDITKTDEKPAEKLDEQADEQAEEKTGERDQGAAGSDAELVDATDEDGTAGDGTDEDDEDDELLQVTDPGSGLGAAGAAVVSAALGAVALTGTWAGKVVAERETLIGQINTSQSGSPAQQISEIYGDAWHSTALVNGVFAFAALVTAVLVLVLARPERPVWVRAVAVAGAVLGGLGLLLSVGTYFDLFLSLPTTGS
ncbi:hypothetical protein AB0G79_32000 [Streptomyces sp. NPDC020807]|uniref:hypothetical protein n=1 Tax=Streptomyces sp. NPDC020807 TaxID=3155119 RepID=UPI0033FC02B2